jgi:SAM-dependent methyltransferase
MTATENSWDILQLYEYSVNSPEGDCDFLHRVFADRYQRKAQLLREDFCGTAGLACEWVGRGEDQYAVGIDWDQLTLDWCKQQHIAKLDPAAQERLTLQPGDVMKGYPWKVDVIAAHNFSWMMFRDRIKLRDYFKKCREGLKKDGVLVLDIYGGKAIGCQ